MERQVSRRQFLQLSALTTASVVAVACGAPATAPAPAAESSGASAAPATASGSDAVASAGKYKEAPMLTEMVTAGKLPAVDERLPVNPRVIPVTEEIGQYGETWYRVAVGAGDAGTISNRLSYETLLRWNEDGSGVVPNVAESYEVNESATEMTFK